MPVLANSSVTQDAYQKESDNIRERFEQTHDGQAAVRERSNLIDSLIRELWTQTSAAAAGAEKFCVAALGGYGRRSLFPYSDIDVLFLHETALSEAAQKQTIPRICQALWDRHLRVSPTTRSLAECGKLHRDNLELNISLLDSRYLCGDEELFEQLHARVIPKMVAREALELQQRLTDLTSARHNKYGHTIFHLEPNIKDYPGGLRDYQVACWLSLISELEKTGVWPAPENLLPNAFRQECGAALEFLSAVRCFLHYRQGRDLNGLTYELQSEAAAAGIGIPDGVPLAPAAWMRTYFRHVRSIYRLTVLFDEVPPARSGLYRLFENRKSRLSNADFSVVEGRVFLRQLASVQDPSVLFALFEFIGRHGLKLTAETERCVEAALPSLRQWAQESREVWPYFRRILVSPYAGAALRAMHRLGVLVVLFPEFQAVDSLVIRDYYHRYTVDEHSFVAIENVHALRTPDSELERRFRDILDGIERPDLLFLAILLHDVGKGMQADDHVAGSLEASAGVLDRLGLDPAEGETVTFLIAKHLRMSATTRRQNIFDPKVVEEFSETVGTTERLKMLTLLTYTDVKSVNPEALTPWKAEMLWQLYAAAFNHLSRTVDDQRLTASNANSERIREVVAAAGEIDAKHITSFLEGFPKRYLLMHDAGEVVTHCEMYDRLKLKDDEPQIDILRRGGYFELVLLTLDCPGLFAHVVGTLSSWGMNILKAEAFSNKAGVVLDTIRFSDRFRTLELNPTEVTRLRRNLAEAVSGEINVVELMEAKFKPASQGPKVKIEPSVQTDNEYSQHSTLIEIIAEDRPGLLYDISSTMAELGCNIEVAIIDTQGQTATDVFHVTCAGTKLDREHQKKIQAALLEQL
ncbi:MAG TPA: [protein-PII] uridylyltransferase [Terriglobales bacterium]|jgi:[protein-PII] uridylyltransferase|nr:[protein-PII] uridylyltransferase [Terriglobales bacterium]